MLSSWKTFLRTEPTNISVAVSGLSGSGKSKLIETLDGYTFTITADKRYFRLSLTECTELPAILVDFDFTLFAFDTTCANGTHEESWNAWGAPVATITAKFPEDKSRVCLVGTKLDLMPPESVAGNVLLSYPAMVKFAAGLHYMNTSAVTGAGIHKLALLIVDQIHPCPSNSSRRITLSDLTDRLLDVFASLFALPVPPSVNRNTEDSYDIPDDDTAQLLSLSPEATAHNAYLSSFMPKNGTHRVSPAYKLTPNLIGKRRNPLEWDGTTYARSHLNIPIPQPRYPHLKDCFITDFIEGKSLVECWNSLGICMRFRIACTMRSYVSQMRRLTRDFPGTPKGGYVYGYVFTNGFYSGPFKTAQSFRIFAEHVVYQGWLNILFSHCWRSRPEEPVITNQYDSPYVFTHGDLGPSNIMLSDDGTLWVIDWASCGFYPKWIEGAAARRYEKCGLKYWNIFMALAFGRPPRYSTYAKYFREAADAYAHLDLPSTY